MSYFGDINKGIKTTIKGLSLTWKHLFDARHTRGPINVEDSTYFQLTKGHVTLQYPQEKLSVPDNGRYQLDCEIDDCIVCDKCAKICPVDCIDIEVIKSPELIRTTSDGSPVRLYAAKFDIDMAKCCFCGLCTTVCPTECLTMDSEYDFSVWDIDEMNFEFASLTAEEIKEKKELYEQFVAEKAVAKALAPTAPTSTPQEGGLPVAAKPFGFKPTVKQSKSASDSSAEVELPVVPKPAGFRPTIKPLGGKPTFTTTAKPQVENVNEEIPTENLPVKAAGFKPSMKPPIAPAISSTERELSNIDKPKPASFKPSMKPPAGKPVFKPSMKPPKKEGSDE